MTIIPYTFPETGAPVRIVTVNGEPWFVGVDAASAIGLADARKSLNLLDEDERHTMPVTDSLGRDQQTIVINEPGLYSLILRSRMPQAKAFKRWITHDVIPSIRRTGSYAAPAVREMTKLEALQSAIESEEARLVAEARVAELEPAAAAWDQLASADQDFSVREAAHILNRDPHIDTGERRLFGVLRGMRLVDQQDRPYQRHSQHVRLRIRSFTNPATGVESAARPQVRITARGLQYLHARLGGAVNVHRHIAEHQLDLPAETALFALPR